MIVSQDDFQGDQYQKEKIILANYVGAIADDWIAQQPKCDIQNQSAAELRRIKRAKRIALQQHINAQIAKDKQAAIDNHSVAFIGIALLIVEAIIASIVEWVTCKILDHYFDK